MHIRHSRVLLAASAIVLVGLASGTAHADQQGLESPGANTPQPGLTTPTPAPPARPEPAAVPQDRPTIVDIIPAPARPRPSQQVTPPQVVAPPSQSEEDQPVAEEPEVPAPTGPDPRMLRVGTETVAVPDWMPNEVQAVAQDAADKAEWYVAAGFDMLGNTVEESDQKAAATLAGGGAGAWLAGGVGAVGGTATGCLTGMAIGGVVGAVVTVAAAPFGAAVGGVIGCMIGGVVVAVPAMIAGALLGGSAGSAAGNALGGAKQIADDETEIGTDTTELG